MGGGAQSTNGTDRDVMFKSNNSQYTVIWLTKEVEGREGEREGGRERESEIACVQERHTVNESEEVNSFSCCILFTRGVVVS